MTAYHGQAGSGLFVGCVVVVLVAVVGFVLVQQEFSFGWPAGMLMIFATVALVGCAGFGVRDRALHDRGRDADCQITSITEKMVNVETYQWVYGLSCRGDGPPTRIEAKSQEPRPVSSRITVGYDPAQTSIGSVGSDGGDGQGPFILAGIAAAVLLLAGLVAAVLD